jgi:hypothetical protein
LTLGITLMAPALSIAASPVFHALGVNGRIVSSVVSQDAADALAQAQWLKNPAYVAAGDYVGFDAGPRFTNPADMVLIFGPTKAVAEKTALAWGTALVRGGVYLATPLSGNGVFVSTSIGIVRRLATDAGGASASQLYSTSPSGQMFHSAWQRAWARNLAGYVVHAPRALPTTDAVCTHGAATPATRLRTWQCPAGWTMAVTPK